MSTVSAPLSFTSIPVGKCVGEHLYLHYLALDKLLPYWQEKVQQASQLAGVDEGRDFNVVKLWKHGDELSLLSYPDFFGSGFPTLGRSWRVSFSRGTTVYRTYEESCNPPILHRKELLLPPGHEGVEEYRALTEAAESLGLFDDPHRIGTREYWYRLLAERGYEIDGHSLVPVANAVGECIAEVCNSPEIQRHLTALSRSNFSAPIQALWRHGLITASRSLFDYGCGRGDDIRALLTNGITATGWDPYYAREAEKHHADTVNLGFVINVIEDLAERVEALQSAYSYTRGILSVAAMLSSQAPPEGKPYRDGYLSSRNTFQKYYSQSQLRDFIEQTLDEPAIAVGPGVFFVFRDKELEQQFLANRYGRKAHTALLRGWVYERVKREGRTSQRKRDRQQKIPREEALFTAHQAIFFSLWERCLELGRPPENGDITESLQQDLLMNVGSLGRAMRICHKYFDPGELERAAQRRKEDLLVFAAMHQFQKAHPYRRLDECLQRDIRYFYGNYGSLQDAARTALFDLVNLERLDNACRVAFERGFGWLEESHSLQLHVSLLPRLPSILRIYVGCATALYGDISQFDLVKIHIRSGKATLMRFEDFNDCGLPRMIERVKVRLREQDLDIFTYDERYPPPLLYHKSRYINEEFLYYDEQVAFEEQLQNLGMLQFDGYGPSAADFLDELRRRRWEVSGMQLARAHYVPDLDDACGTNFTYRNLIECGHTQQRTKLDNLPRQPETYTALYELASNILDPVIDYFGMIELTYGFCSAVLAKQISTRIAPHLDQHAGHEKNKLGKPICSRLGIACDFLIRDEDMEEVAYWVANNTPFDRIYYYGRNRPIHVSFSHTPARQFVHMIESSSGKFIPKVKRIKSEVARSYGSK